MSSSPLFPGTSSPPLPLPRYLQHSQLIYPYLTSHLNGVYWLQQVLLKLGPLKVLTLLIERSSANSSMLSSALLQKLPALGILMMMALPRTLLQGFVLRKVFPVVEAMVLERVGEERRVWEDVIEGRVPFGRFITRGVDGVAGFFGGLRSKFAPGDEWRGKGDGFATLVREVFATGEIGGEKGIGEKNKVKVDSPRGDSRGVPKVPGISAGNSSNTKTKASGSPPKTSPRSTSSIQNRLTEIVQSILTKLLALWKIVLRKIIDILLDIFPQIEDQCFLLTAVSLWSVDVIMNLWNLFVRSGLSSGDLGKLAFGGGSMKHVGRSWDLPFRFAVLETVRNIVLSSGLVGGFLGATALERFHRVRREGPKIREGEGAGTAGEETDGNGGLDGVDSFPENDGNSGDNNSGDRDSNNNSPVTRGTGSRSRSQNLSANTSSSSFDQKVEVPEPFPPHPNPRYSGVGIGMDSSGKSNRTTTFTPGSGMDPRISYSQNAPNLGKEPVFDAFLNRFVVPGEGGSSSSSSRKRTPSPDSTLRKSPNHGNKNGRNRLDSSYAHYEIDGSQALPLKEEDFDDAASGTGSSSSSAFYKIVTWEQTYQATKNIILSIFCGSCGGIVGVEVGRMVFDLIFGGYVERRMAAAAEFMVGLAALTRNTGMGMGAGATGPDGDALSLSLSTRIFTIFRNVIRRLLMGFWAWLRPGGMEKLLEEGWVGAVARASGGSGSSVGANNIAMRGGDEWKLLWMSAYSDLVQFTRGV